MDYPVLSGPAKQSPPSVAGIAASDLASVGSSALPTPQTAPPSSPLSTVSSVTDSAADLTADPSHLPKPVPAARQVLVSSQRSSAESVPVVRLTPKTRHSHTSRVHSRPRSEPSGKRIVSSRSSSTLQRHSAPGSEASAKRSAYNSGSASSGASKARTSPGKSARQTQSSENTPGNSTSSSSSWGLAAHAREIFAIPRQGSIAALDMPTYEELLMKQQKSDIEHASQNPELSSGQLDPATKTVRSGSRQPLPAATSNTPSTPNLKQHRPSLFTRESATTSCKSGKWSSRESSPPGSDPDSEYFPQAPSTLTKAPFNSPTRPQGPQPLRLSSKCKRHFGVGEDVIVHQPGSPLEQIIYGVQTPEQSPARSPVPFRTHYGNKGKSDGTLPSGLSENGIGDSLSARRNFHARLGLFFRKHSSAPEAGKTSQESSTRDRNLVPATQQHQGERGSPFRIELPPRMSSFAANEAQRITTPPVPPGSFGYNVRNWLHDHHSTGKLAASSPTANGSSPLAGVARAATYDQSIRRALPGLDEGVPSEFDVPEHFPSSPLCPRHPKHKSGGTGRCPFHGPFEQGE